MPWADGSSALRSAAELEAEILGNVWGGTVVDQGADPTGVSDSTEAFQDALDAGDLVIRSGTYKVGLVTYEGAEDRTILVPPGERVTIIQTNILGVFRLRGGWDALGSISSIAAGNVDGNDDGTTNTRVSLLTMSGATTVAKGDVVMVVSDDRPVGFDPSASGGSTSRRGEYSMVALDSAGTTVSLGNQLVDAYTSSPRLARLWDVSFKVLGDLTFDGDPALIDDSGFGATIELRAARYCQVRGAGFNDIPGRAIANFTYCSSFEDLRFKSLSNRPSLSHFGYGVADGGHATRVRNCHGENLRHMYTETHNDVSAGSSSYEYFSGGRFSLVSDCTATSCQSAAFDTHSTAYGITFDNCMAFGTFQGASSTGGGFTGRGRRITFNGCKAITCMGGFNIAVVEGCYLNNCEVYLAAYEPILTGVSSTELSDPALTALGQRDVVVRGGMFEGSRDSSVSKCVHIGNTSFASDITFEGVTFRLIGTSSGSVIWDVYGSARVRAADVTFDLTGWTGGTASLNLIQLRTVSGADVKVRGVRIPCGTVGVDVTPSLMVGLVGSTTSPVWVENYDYENGHANGRDLTVGHSNLSAWKASGRKVFGTSWFQKGLSSLQGVTAATSASLAVISTTLDPSMVIRLTGSAGAVTLGALPAANFTGQRVTFLNESNGIVTLPSITPTIAVNGTLTVVYGGTAAWRVENLYP